MTDPSPGNGKQFRRTAWIWFVGCAAWLVDSAVSFRLGALPRAKLAFMVALVFLAAGFFYRNPRQR
jgi:hypothetical protein